MVRVHFFNSVGWRFLEDLVAWRLDLAADFVPTIVCSFDSSICLRLLRLVFL
jgi:hypothetical protein